MRKTGLIMKTIAVALGMSVLFQATAMAAPYDELTEILERQQEVAEDHKSLLDEYVDFSGIGEAMDDNGLQLQLNGAVEVEEFRTALEANFQSEKDAQKWLLELGLDLQDMDFLDIGLFADSGILALSVPQFLEKAVAVRSGSLTDQLEGSVLSEMIDISGVPELELQFIPDNTQKKNDTFGDPEDSLETKTEEFEKNIRVEKAEDGDTTVYTVVCETADILDLYRAATDAYLKVFENVGIPVTINGSSDVEGEIEKGLNTAQQVLGDEVAIDYRVKDGLVEGLHYGISLDTAALTGDKAAQEDGVTIDGVDSSAPRYMVFNLTYTQPENPEHGFVFSIIPQDESRTAIGTVDITYACENDGIAETHTCTLNISAEDESISHTLYTSRFDTSTGKFTIEASIPEDLSGGADTAAALRLDSTFSEVEKGRSFVLTVDELYGEAQGESGSVSGEIMVSADPGEIREPENPYMLFDMTEEDISLAVMEIAVNAQKWEASVNELLGIGTAETEMVTE